MRSAAGTNCRPAAVCETRRVARAKRTAPSSLSACWIVRLRLGWEMPSSAAAATNLPQRANVMIARRCLIESSGRPRACGKCKPIHAETALI
jgi:hypothetical protein